jgi:hypothetical protein
MNNIINNLSAIANSAETKKLIDSFNTSTKQNEWLSNWHHPNERINILNKLGNKNIEELYQFIKTLAGMGFTTTILNNHLKRNTVQLGGKKKKTSKKVSKKK